MSDLSSRLAKAIKNPRHTWRSLKYVANNFWKTRIIRDEYYLALDRWRKDNGDNVYRYRYPLNKDSLVFDLGGYKGEFTSQIRKKFDCTVYLFEPSKENFTLCKEKFQGDHKVKCFNIALSNHDGIELLSNNEDGSRLGSNEKVGGDTVSVMRISSFLKEDGCSNIDLIKINIEGGEYPVLQDLIESHRIEDFKHIQVQFHNFVVDAEEMRRNIRAHLLKTHAEDWNYPFVWESWTRQEIRNPEEALPR